MSFLPSEITRTTSSLLEECLSFTTWTSELQALWGSVCCLSHPGCSPPADQMDWYSREGFACSEERRELLWFLDCASSNWEGLKQRLEKTSEGSCCDEWLRLKWQPWRWLSSGAGCLFKVELNIQVFRTGLDMGKSGRRPGTLEEWTFLRLGCEGQGRGLVTCPLISQHCQISRLRCQRYWIRGWGSAEGGAGNVEAEVDNVQIEMLFKILN